MADCAEFLRKVTVSGECWLWAGQLHKQAGVPMLGRQTARTLAARLFSAEKPRRGIGFVPVCGAATCVRIDHLRAADHPDVWFWPKVTRGDGCWVWTGGREKNGYGRTGRKKGKTRGAHRVSWELAHGPIASGLYVLHRCDNPPCVRPSHLFLGTQAENRLDCVKKGRQPRGARQAMAKLTEIAVAEIRQKFASGESKTALAATYGVTRQNVHFILARKTWQHVD